MTEPSKIRGGRPRGTSPKQQHFRQLVAQGVPELRALELAGYTHPERELKRQVAHVAEAKGADPREVLRRVAQFGSTSDRISACAKLLALPQAEGTAPDRAFVLVQS